MLCGLFCALRVLTSGPVHTLMAKDTEGEQKMDEYYQVVQTLPQWLARPLGQLPSEDAETVHELRLRLGCAPQFTVQGCSCTPAQLAPELNALQTMQLTPLQMEEILFALCGGSVHTHQTEIAQGYVTLEPAHYAFSAEHTCVHVVQRVHIHELLRQLPLYCYFHTPLHSNSLFC